MIELDRIIYIKEKEYAFTKEQQEQIDKANRVIKKAKEENSKYYNIIRDSLKVYKENIQLKK